MAGLLIFSSQWIPAFAGMTLWGKRRHASSSRPRNITYVIPVQAKSGNDRLSRVQIEQDVALCANKLPSLICRPVGVYMMRTDLVALFEFEQDGDDIGVVTEKHYRLVPPDEVTDQDLVRYQQRFSDSA